MKRIIFLLVLTIFLIGCKCENAGDVNRVCKDCHFRCSSESTKSYKRIMRNKCDLCHQPMSCEKGYSYILEKQKPRNVKKPKKSRKNKSRR